jgi:hypothetical protein
MGVITTGPSEPRGCAFKVIRVAPVTLAVGGDIDVTFGFFLGENFAPAQEMIISFMLEQAQDLELHVSINDVAYSRNYLPGPGRVVQQVLTKAGRTGTNELTFTVRRGSFSFSNLVIWYYTFFFIESQPPS